MTPLDFAKRINVMYQNIYNPTDWKTDLRTQTEWEKLPATTQFVWRAFASALLKNFNITEKEG